MSRRLRAALIAAVLGAGRSAQADEGEPMLALVWQAPSGCPDGAQVTARVEELVGHLPAGRHTLTARGEITRGAPFRLELVIGDRPTPRKLTDPDCGKLAEAAAIILALDLDPDALSRPRPPTEPEPPPPEEPPAPLVVPPAPRKKTRVKPPPPLPAIHLGFDAHVVLDVGSLPRTTGGIAFGLDVKRGPLVLSLDGTRYGERFTTQGPRGGAAGANVDLMTLAPLVCLEQRFGIALYSGCLGVELGREHTEGVGIARPQRSASFWGAGLALLRVRVGHDLPVSPAGAVGLAVPFADPDVVIGGAGTVFTPSAVAFRAFLGLEGNFF